MKTQTANPLSNLLAAVHDAYLQQREAGAAKRLRACRTRLPDQPRPRKARRLQIVDAPAPLIAPLPPVAVSPAPTFAKPITMRADSALAFANIKRKPPAAHLQISAPSAAQVFEKAAQLERAGATITRNDDGDFSSPELTAWYLSVCRTTN